MNLAPQQWLSLKQNTRQALVKIFRIPQSTFTHVVNNNGVGTVESDGHTYEDLKAISLEEMKSLTHSGSEDFFEQFEMIVKMVESEGSTPVTEEVINNVPAGVSVVTENATPNEPTAASTGTNAGAKEGVNKEAPVSQETVLPVSGGVNEVDRGSNEPLPNTGGDNTASLATEAAEVDVKKPKANKPVK